MNGRGKYLALTGKPLIEEAWNRKTRVNVKSNRVNTKAQKDHSTHDITAEGPYVWATEEDYAAFLDLNEMKASPTTSGKKVSKEDAELDSQPMCKIGTAGSILYSPEDTDPRKLPKAALDALCDFHVSGLRGWGVVTEVIDGDTIDLVAYVPLNELSLGHVYKRYSKTGVRSFIHTKNQDSGFFAKFRCRLLGIDSMEKTVPEGRFAKAVTKAMYASVGGHVWCEFSTSGNVEEKDLYGRRLVELYKDETKEVSYNNFLFGFNTTNTTIVEKYDGGTKSEFSKNLAKRDKEATEAMEKKLKGRLEKYLATLED